MHRNPLISGKNSFFSQPPSQTHPLDHPPHYKILDLPLRTMSIQNSSCDIALYAPHAP